MEIRVIRPEDAMELAKLNAAAFSVPVVPEKVQPYEHERLGAFEDGRLLAAVTIRPYECRWGRTYLPALGVGGVATMPLARRGGLIRRLFDELDRLAVEREWAFGMLYPFSYRYYRQFGYERILPRVTVELPFSELAQIPRSADGELYDGSQAEELLALYTRYADAHPLMARRTDMRAWESAPETNLRYTYLHRGAEGFDAYASLRYEAETIAVTELVYTTPESLQGILGMLRLFDGQRPRVCFAGLPQTSPVLPLLREYKACSYSHYNGAMGRVLDTQRLLREHVWPQEAGRFTLGVEDALPGCAGRFAVEYGGGEAGVRRTEAEAELLLPAPELARVLLGGMGVGGQELAFLPGARVLDAARAEDFARAFPRRMHDMTEHF